MTPKFKPPKQLSLDQMIEPNKKRNQDNYWNTRPSERALADMFLKSRK